MHTHASTDAVHSDKNLLCVQFHFSVQLGAWGLCLAGDCQSLILIPEGL